MTKSIERAQSKVENHNYEIRKQVLEYDDVMNKQREIIYADRRAMLEGKSIARLLLQTLEAKVATRSTRTRPRTCTRASGTSRRSSRARADLPDQAAA